jgi:hypothetical protein
MNEWTSFGVSFQCVDLFFEPANKLFCFFGTVLRGKRPRFFEIAFPVRVILTRNFAGTFEIFQERSDRSCVTLVDVLLGSREEPCHIARLQVSLVSLRIHQDRISFTVHRKHNRPLSAMNLA